nr:M23 family metallopeptidase [uncultured Blautia sp.]
MKKNRTMKVIFNVGALAVLAALGISAYQLGTSKKGEIIQEILPMESVQKSEVKDTKEEASTQTDTSLVQAETDSDSVTAGENPVKEEAQTEDIKTASSAEVAADQAAGTGTGTAAGLNMAPELLFSEDTLMEWPVNGNILIDYSMDSTTYFPTLDQYRLSSGIAVQAVQGAPVQSAVNGKVLNIAQDAQTGTTVTMELGNGYQAIYGQLTDLQVAQGDTVKKGTTIGYVGTPTKYYSKEGSNLYFAMKKDGKPIDPIAYLP